MLYQNIRLKQIKVATVFWFVVITLLIHYSYRYWANSLDYFPISEFTTNVNIYLRNCVFKQFAFIIDKIFESKIFYVDQKILFKNNTYISISSGCSGLKQILQFFLLFLFLKGYVFNKCWFILLGILVMHLTNILRLLILSFVLMHYPDKWNLFHDDILRAMFYAPIFIMWVFWIERLRDFRYSKFFKLIFKLQ
jgi:exosortase/archaeosortase family protein